MSKVPKFQFEDYPPAKPAKVANLQPDKAPTLASLATLAGGKNENQSSTPAVKSPEASGKPISICPKCQGEIILKTSFGKIFCYQCLAEFNGELGDTTGFPEIDLAMEAAIERSAILEFDGGLDRKQADETAWCLYIQPVIEDLVRKGLNVIEGSAPGSQITTLSPAKPAKVAKHYSREAPQASPPSGSVNCAVECPWHELNPWTRDPALSVWCHYRMEPLAAGSPACEEFNRGEVPSRQPHKQVPAVLATTPPDPQESTFTCADCPHFQPNNGRNPLQGRGRCLKRNKGRFGCAAACEAAITNDL